MKRTERETGREREKRKKGCEAYKGNRTEGGEGEQWHREKLSFGKEKKRGIS